MGRFSNVPIIEALLKRKAIVDTAYDCTEEIGSLAW